MIQALRADSSILESTLCTYFLKLNGHGKAFMASDIDFLIKDFGSIQKAIKTNGGL